MGETEIYAEINTLKRDVADLRERMARTEGTADRMPSLEEKLDKLTTLLNKVVTKQAVLIMKVAAITGALSAAGVFLIS